MIIPVMGPLGAAADHTYVISSAGHSWGCFGRSAGGTALSSGPGNYATADCLSNPNAESGLVFASSGVCHQAANRILFPAGLTVSAARGARFSIFMYGVYGVDLVTHSEYSPTLNPWPELVTCNALHSHP